MKTIKFKLIATMFTLAAVIALSSFEASAQRRSGENNRQSTETRRSTSNTRKQSEEKSATVRSQQQNQSRSTSTNRSQTVETRRGTASRDPFDHNSRSVQQPANAKSGQQSSTSGNVRRSSNQGNSGQGVSNRSNDRNQQVRDRNENRDVRVGTSTADGRRNTGRTVSDNRDFYRVDKSDRRYTPNNDYRGSNNYWSGNNRSNNLNYNRNDARYYRNYNYLKRSHWDRRWESYRWNYSSWRDYYRGYNPRSYMYSRYYFRDPRFGHVMRRFDYRPLVFVHNNVQFFCYNGHFFRYRPGVGYILVDLPYGFTFRYLPAGYYERVFINGFAYFRVGNLFFEATPYGYSMVHFPDRYYAYDDGFEPAGYYYDDIYW